jgi:hypothetical protein
MPCLAPGIAGPERIFPQYLVFLNSPGGPRPSAVSRVTFSHESRVVEMHCANFAAFTAEQGGPWTHHETENLVTRFPFQIIQPSRLRENLESSSSGPGRLNSTHQLTS